MGYSQLLGQAGSVYGARLALEQMRREREAQRYAAVNQALGTAVSGASTGMLGLGQMLDQMEQRSRAQDRAAEQMRYDRGKAAADTRYSVEKDKRAAQFDEDKLYADYNLEHFGQQDRRAATELARADRERQHTQLMGKQDIALERLKGRTGRRPGSMTQQEIFRAKHFEGAVDAAGSRLSFLQRLKAKALAASKAGTPIDTNSFEGNDAALIQAAGLFGGTGSVSREDIDYIDDMIANTTVQLNRDRIEFDKLTGGEYPPPPQSEASDEQLQEVYEYEELPAESSTQQSQSLMLPRDESVFVDDEYIQKSLTPEEEMRLAGIEHHAARGEGIKARERTLDLKALADERRRKKRSEQLDVKERLQGRGATYDVEVAARDRRIANDLRKKVEQDRLEGSTKFLKSVNDANRRAKSNKRLGKEEGHLQERAKSKRPETRLERSLRGRGRGYADEGKEGHKGTRLEKTLQLRTDSVGSTKTESELKEMTKSKGGAIMGGLFDMSKDLLLGDDARSGQMRDLFVVDPDAFYASLSKELEGLEPEERGFIAREELLKATDGRLDLEEFVSGVA